MPIAVKKIDLPEDNEKCFIKIKNLEKEAELLSIIYLLYT